MKNTSVKTMKKYNFNSVEDVKKYCLDFNIDVEKIVREIQPICFDNAVEAYALGTAIALKSNVESADCVSR